MDNEDEFDQEVEKFFKMYQKTLKLNIHKHRDIEKTVEQATKKINIREIASGQFVLMALEFTGLQMIQKINAYKNAKPLSQRPPGRQLTSLLQAICTKRIFDSVFAQTIADAREEYFEALFEKKYKLARWRKIQLYLVIIVTGFSWVSASAVKKIITIYKAI